MKGKHGMKMTMFYKLHRLQKWSVKKKWKDKEKADKKEAQFEKKNFGLGVFCLFSKYTDQRNRESRNQIKHQKL